MSSQIDADDVLALWGFHRSLADSCSMTDESASPSNKKMKYKFDKYQNEISPSHVVSNIDEIKDTEIGHVDMSEFLERAESSTSHDMQLLLRSHIHLVSSFPVAALDPEFVLACASHFDSETRTIKDDDGNVIIRLDPETINRIFRVPDAPTYSEISKNSAHNHYEQKKNECNKHINNKWLLKSRPCVTRISKLYRSDFKEEINYMITLLSRIMGLKVSSMFEGWMYKFIVVIRKAQHPIFSGEIISDSLCEQLAQVPTMLNFYMNSYLVYIAASLRQFPGLSTKGDRSMVPVWEYYEQLTLRQSQLHYRRVQDAFFGTSI